MKFTTAAIIVGLASFAMASPANMGRTFRPRALTKRDDTSACCQNEACVADCQNGFGSNPVGEAACIESCGGSTGVGNGVCYCCMDHSQQIGSDGTSACANNGGSDDNTDDCTCPSTTPP